MPVKNWVLLGATGRWFTLVAALGVAGCGSSPERAGGDYATAVTVEVHHLVRTILVVRWTQATAADSTFLEFSFEDDDVITSPPKPGSAGAREEVVLGVPAETDVTIHVVSRHAGTDYKTSGIVGRTGALPTGLPDAEVLSYDPALASRERYLLGAVEDSLGGCGPPCYNVWTDWIYIMDRKGRMVWYHSDQATNPSSAYPRVARDGQYLWLDVRPTNPTALRGVVKMTLDSNYVEPIALPVSECIDVTDDGSLLFDTSGGVLSERTSDGAVRSIWSCPQEFGATFYCFSNTVSWNPATDTILLSFPEENTVVEIDRQSGGVVGRYGSAPDSYAFSPSTWQFEYQHFPNLTPAGTLLVSTHMPGFSDTYEPVAGEHAFVEFAIDRENRRLVEEWVYNAGPEWPMYKGMAVRLENGNTLANYGTGGVIREITPDGQTAFDVKFDSPAGDDFYNKMVGHNVLIDDLYELNRGP